MSRSRKKNPVIKDVGHMKGLHNRLFRRVNKQRLKEGKDLKEMDELVNKYAISDWRFELFEGQKKNKIWIDTEEEYEEELRRFKRK